MSGALKRPKIMYYYRTRMGDEYWSRWNDGENFGYRLMGVYKLYDEKTKKIKKVKKK